jgi:hypothetical protein
MLESTEGADHTMDEAGYLIAEASAKYLAEKAKFASEMCGVPPDQLVPMFESVACKYNEPKWFDEDHLENGVPWLNPSMGV